MVYFWTNVRVVRGPQNLCQKQDCGLVTFCTFFPFSQVFLPLYFWNPGPLILVGLGNDRLDDGGLHCTVPILILERTWTLSTTPSQNCVLQLHDHHWKCNFCWNFLRPRNWLEGVQQLQALSPPTAGKNPNFWLISKNFPKYYIYRTFCTFWPIFNFLPKMCPQHLKIWV